MIMLNKKTAKKWSFPKPSANQVRYFVVMLIGVLMNQLLFTLINYVNLPVWLDCTGTAYAALVLEPTAGLIVGLINNFYLSAFVYGSNSLLYYLISAAVALIVGIRLKNSDGSLNKSKIFSTAIMVFGVSTIMATALTLWRSGGIPSGNWETMYYNHAVSWGMIKPLACLFGTSVVKLFDTAAVVVVVALFYAATPPRLKKGQ